MGSANHVSVPSWDEIHLRLTEVCRRDALNGGSNPPAPTPTLTIYRDEEGSCPYVGRVWLALEAKKIPYNEKLINLFDKPSWYTDLVPGGKVPAIEFDDDASPSGKKVMWESLDILRTLDEMFPVAPKLFSDAPGFSEALSLAERVAAAGHGVSYGRMDERDELSAKLDDELNKVESLLSRRNDSVKFLVGDDLSAADAVLVFSLERLRYELPVTMGIHPLEGRPNLRAWLDGMDSYAPYAMRVAGDQYSKIARSPWHVDRFAAEVDPAGASVRVRRASLVIKGLSDAFADDEEGSIAKDSSAAAEAMTKLSRNHERIVAKTLVDSAMDVDIGIDISTGRSAYMIDPTDEEVADEVLRVVSCIILDLIESNFQNSISSIAEKKMYRSVREKRPRTKVVCERIASRLYAPRDMNAPAVKLVRAVLISVGGK